MDEYREEIEKLKEDKKNMTAEIKTEFERLKRTDEFGTVTVIFTLVCSIPAAFVAYIISLILIPTHTTIATVLATALAMFGFYELFDRRHSSDEFLWKCAERNVKNKGSIEDSGYHIGDTLHSIAYSDFLGNKYYSIFRRDEY